MPKDPANQPDQQTAEQPDWKQLPMDLLFVLATAMLEKADRLPKGDPDIKEKLMAANAILDFLSEQETSFSNLSHAPFLSMSSTPPDQKQEP